MAASGAELTAGYTTGGGGALLDRALDYDPSAHTTDNARSLVASVFGGRTADGSPAALTIPDEARRDAAARLPVGHAGPVVGVHVSGGRAIKQWAPQRFTELAHELPVRGIGEELPPSEIRHGECGRG
jgi:hypothetical protein